MAVLTSELLYDCLNITFKPSVIIYVSDTTENVFRKLCKREQNLMDKSIMFSGLDKKLLFYLTQKSTHLLDRLYEVMKKRQVISLKINAKSAIETQITEVRNFINRL